MKLTPFEDTNLIFIDTEFTSLDPYEGELLSIGIVKLNGDKLYIELECDATPTEWVQKNIVPMLDGPKFSRKDTIRQIKEFLGTTNPYAVAFVDNYDTIYLTKLFGVDKLPFRWMTIDFTSVLFGMGVNPVKFIGDQSGARAFYKKLGIKKSAYRQHHALDDAQLLRDVWVKMTQDDSM